MTQNQCEGQHSRYPSKLLTTR